MPAGIGGPHLFVIRLRTNYAVEWERSLRIRSDWGGQSEEFDSMRFHLWGPAGIGFVILGLLMNNPAAGGERSREVTREDLIATLEQDNGSSKGAPEAPVVMVDFSDFQCTYCVKFVKETLPKIDEQYVRTGKVRLVFRHLAILGEASVTASLAAACAQDQGKFWEYHDTLFLNRSPLAFASTRLKQYAADLGLDRAKFATCLDGKTHAKRVESETLLGRALGANGTPAFLINGQLVMGAYPFDVFQRGLDSILANIGAKPPSPRP
jgi:protein-disulfide isomerase